MTATWPRQEPRARHLLPLPLIARSIDSRASLETEPSERSKRPEMEGYTVNSYKTELSSKSRPIHLLSALLEGPTAVLNACSALNPAFHISVVKSSTPASTALPNSLSLAVPAGTTGTVGFANSGHFVRLDLARVLLLPFPIASRDENFGDLHDRIPVFHGAAVAATSETFTSSAGWKQITFRMTLTSTPASIANLFTIESTARPWLDKLSKFAMLTSFPPTFLNRINGMRLDLSETLQEMRPSFFCFPGGNNLEWSGLYEYLQWIEDIGMQPIMAVWAGYSLDGRPL
ncbi:hypothetical protein C8R44DRAFT_892590 [Mycena epipterygia]|nr:hypothetical protein C8R44DRAFT_892590 [Mycena epipterygia]